MNRTVDYQLSFMMLWGEAVCAAAIWIVPYIQKYNEHIFTCRSPYLSILTHLTMEQVRDWILFISGSLCTFFLLFFTDVILISSASTIHL